MIIIDILESAIESYFQNEVKRHNGLALKFTSPSSRGVPDQIVLYDSQTYFVEMKAPNKKPRKSQITMHKTFKQHGVPVHTLDSYEAVDLFIQETLKAEPVAKSKETFNLINDMF